MCFPALAAVPALFGSVGATIGTVATVGSTVLGVVGAQQSANANAAAQEATAAQDRQNAIIAQRNAEDARQRGIVAQQDVELKNRAKIGQQANVLSERNISVSSGSALDVLGDTAMFGKLDELTTRNNAEREALSYETQSYNFSTDATQSDLAASNSKRAGAITAFSTALGGVNSLASRGMKIT